MPRPSRTPHAALSALVIAMMVASCGGGDEGDASVGVDPSGGIDATDDAPESDDATGSTAETFDEAPGDDAPADGAIDPVFHHVSADAPAGSWGPLCNADNRDRGIPGWRITVPADWTNASSGGSASDGSEGFYGLGFSTPDGFDVSVDWVGSVSSSSARSGGAPVGDVDFDGEAVTVMDHSSDEATIFSIDFVAKSAGGFVEVTGEPEVHQVSVVSPVEMAMTQEAATEILTSIQRERCAIYDALALENAFAMAPLLPVFDGGDPLGKSLPTSERLPYDPMSALVGSASSYTADQLAYIVGFDQTTSECFVANVVPTLPTAMEDMVTFSDPITPIDEAGVAAMDAGLAGC